MFEAKTGSFSERLRVLRETNGLTQTELSEQLAGIGVRFSQARISRLERGWSPPSREVLGALAQVLDTSVTYLLTGNPDSRHVVSKGADVSHEAEEVARLIEKLPGAHREAILSALRALLKASDLKIAN
jgi:transcriptional regulator with XRE-family HTH domain